MAKKLENKQANAFFSKKDLSEYKKIKLHLCPHKLSLQYHLTPQILTRYNLAPILKF